MPEPWQERRRQYLEFADRLETWKDLQFERDTLSGLVEMLEAGVIHGAARNGSKLAVWTEKGLRKMGWTEAAEYVKEWRAQQPKSKGASA